MSLISAQDLTKVYTVGELRVHAIKSVSFVVERSSFVSFVGPSGSGKTTLLNLIGCLDRPTSGSLTVAGADTSVLSRTEAADFRGKNLGFIFQDFNLMPILTVYENVEYPLLVIQNVSNEERKKRILSLLDTVGVLDQKDKYPDQISGGQKQRVAIARALVTNPRLVLADEPTANLDSKTAFRIIDTMHQMRDELGVTFVFSTHDRKIVSEVEHIYTLTDGKITEKAEGQGGGDV
ncbi:MAG: ATP-binding cassette domain-containing protein [Candidatus Aminicenantes bacterium]|nr:ATP-binding cassette domain-containing protein [Candidatus Aminicenantes bacterium]